MGVKQFTALLSSSVLIKNMNVIGKEEREHSTIMGLIALHTIVILTGLIILLIGLNEVVTVTIIIIKAVGGSSTMDPGSGASEKTCRKRQEEEERDKKHKLQERGRTVSNKHF